MAAFKVCMKIEELVTDIWSNNALAKPDRQIIKRVKKNLEM